MSKPLRVAGEVDSYCTKCRMVLNHRIVSMKASKPHQVICLTCKAQHLFRGQAPGEKAAPKEKDGVKATRSSGRSPSIAPKSSGTRAEQARRDREQSWEKAISGRSPNEFKAYNVSGVFHEGDLLRHKKFGDGLVTRVIDAGKVEVLFRDEPRTLAHGMTA